MKYLKTFERYNFIDLLNISEFESKLGEIEKTFLSLPKMDLTEIVMDLEDIGVKFYSEILVSTIWKGEELQQSRRRTSSGEFFNYYKTKDYYTGESFFSKKTVKSMSSEMVHSIILTKSQDEITNLFNNDLVKRHFTESIEEEAINFKSKIEQGWMPCFAVAKMKVEKDWEMKQNIVDAFFELREKAINLCGYEIVFLPTAEEPSIILIDKKYIQNL